MDGAMDQLRGTGIRRRHTLYLGHSERKHSYHRPHSRYFAIYALCFSSIASELRNISSRADDAMLLRHRRMVLTTHFIYVKMGPPLMLPPVSGILRIPASTKSIASRANNPSQPFAARIPTATGSFSSWCVKLLKPDTSPTG